MNRKEQPEFRYVMYARKSSEYEDSQIQSIERQTEDLAALIARERLSLFEETLIESKSAFHPGRQEFSKMVQWTMEGKVNAWLCWHANRLSRNPVDTGTIVYLMDMGKLHHIRTRERVYFNTPSDKFLLQMELTVSKKDSDDKSALIRSGVQRRHRRGYPSALPPLGYKLMGSGRSGHSYWAVDKPRFALVKEVFERFLGGRDSLRTITRYAAEIGLKTPVRRASGGVAVVRATMRRNILGNSVYAGFFHGSDGQRYRLDETLPRAISEDEFERIEGIIGSRLSGKKRRPRTRPAAYRNIISGSDGHPLGVEVKFQLICDCKRKFSYLNRESCPACFRRIETLENPKYLEYTYYYPTRDRRDPSRIARVISEPKIDRFLIEHLASRIRLCRELRDWAVEHLGELNDRQLRERDDKANRLDELERQYSSRRKRLRELYSGGHITEEEFKSDAADLERTRAEREAQLDEELTSREEVEKAHDLAVELRHVLEDGTPQAKNQALSDARLNLTWDGKKLFISNAESANRLLERVKNLRSEKPHD